MLLPPCTLASALGADGFIEHPIKTIDTAAAKPAAK
jgi:hypothetical protein